MDAMFAAAGQIESDSGELPVQSAERFPVRGGARLAAPAAVLTPPPVAVQRGARPRLNGNGHTPKKPPSLQTPQQTGRLDEQPGRLQHKQQQAGRLHHNGTDAEEVVGRVPTQSSPPSAGDSDVSRLTQTCGHCGHVIRASFKLSGKRVKCPGCGQPVLLGGAAPTPSGAGSTRGAAPVAADASARQRLITAVEAAVALPAPDLGLQRGTTLSRREWRTLSRDLAAAAGDSAAARDLDKAGAALRQLAQSADERAGPLLLAHLDNLPPLLRTQAVRTLGELREPAALEPLLRMLLRHETMLLPAVLYALGLLGDRRAVVPLLWQAAADSDQHVRVVDALVAIGANAIPVLNEQAEQEGRPAIRRIAVEVLGRLRASSAGGLLSRLVAHSDPELRRLAAEALGEISDAGAAKVLVQALKDPVPEVRAVAAAALGRMPSPKLAPFLSKLIDDPHRTVRWEAVRALGECREPSVVAALTPLLRCGDEDLEFAALEAVGRLGDASVVPQLATMLEPLVEDPEASVRVMRIVDSFKRLKDGRAVLPLVELLGHRNDRIRARAAEALGQIGDPSAVPLLADALCSDHSEQVQVAAAKALGDLKDPSALPALQRGLDETDHVRCRAVIAIGEIADPTVVPTIAKMLHDTSPQVRYHAASVLGKIGDHSTRKLLEPLANDPEDMVQRAAFKSLSELGDTRDETIIRREARKRGREKSGRKWSAADLVPSALAGLVGPRTLVVLGGFVAAGLIAAAIWFNSFPSGEPAGLVRRAHVEGLCFGPDGNSLAAGRTFGLIEIWDIAAQQAQPQTQATGKFIAFDPSGQRLLCCDDLGSRLTEIDSGEVIAQDKPMRAVAVRPELTHAVTLDLKQPRIVVWDLQAGQASGELKYDPRTMSAFHVGPGGTVCAVGTKDGNIYLVQVDDRSIARELKAGKAEVTALALGNDGALAASTSTGDILIWKQEGGRPGVKLDRPGPGRITWLAFVGPERLVALRGVNVEVWDLNTKQVESTTVDLSIVTAIAVSSDGSRLAVGSNEHPQVLVYDLQTLQPIAELDVK
jgi:HEAT repeat protein